jgi:hypothetical protein
MSTEEGDDSRSMHGGGGGGGCCCITTRRKMGASKISYPTTMKPFSHPHTQTLFIGMTSSNLIGVALGV